MPLTTRKRAKYLHVRGLNLPIRRDVVFPCLLERSGILNLKFPDLDGPGKILKFGLIVIYMEFT